MANRSRHFHWNRPIYDELCTYLLGLHLGSAAYLTHGLGIHRLSVFDIDSHLRARSRSREDDEGRVRRPMLG